MYSVVSPKKDEYPAFEKFFKEYTKYPMDLLIKENGSSGDHPHLNIIWCSSITKRTCDFTGLLKKHMVKAELPNTNSPVLLRTMKIVNADFLIGGYLQKESAYEILFDSKKYDIAALKAKYGKKVIGKYRPTRILSFCDAPFDIIEFCENNDIDYLKYCKTSGINTSTARTRYSTESSSVSRILMLMQKRLNIQTHHLHKKTYEIHLAILAHYDLSDDIDFT